MDVFVEETCTALDERLHALAEQLRGRQAGRQPGPRVGLSVSALGVGDAFAAGPWTGQPTGDEPAPELVVPVRLVTGAALVGPLTRTDGSTSPCPQCLGRRWQALRPMPERQALEEDAAKVLGAPTTLTRFATDTLWELCSALVEAGTWSVVYHLDWQTLSVTVAELIPDSGCPRCARHAQMSPDRPPAVALLPQRKTDVSSYRTTDTRDLRLPIRGLVNPVCGVLGASAMRDYRSSATAPVTGAFQVRSKWGYFNSFWSGHATNFATSERLAVLEGLERHAGQRPQGSGAAVFAPYNEVADDALDPAGLGYHDDFYANNHHYAPFAPDRPMYWVWGTSLRDGRRLLVPEQLVYYIDRRPDQPQFVQECSNGCASGSSLTEAALHGLLELVERDAFLLSWYGTARLTEIDPRTVHDTRVQLMCDRVSLLGYDLRLFDLRADIPVPAVAAVGVRRDGGLGLLCFAAGASLDPTGAVRAAVCETASYVPGFTARVSAQLPLVRAMAADYSAVTELSHHPLLFGLPEMADQAAFLFDDPPLRPLGDVYADWLERRPRGLDLADDLRCLVDVVAATGSDVVVVDQTSAEQAAIGLHTACVIAPGLVPIDFGWQRQRVLHHPRLRRFLERGPQGPDRLGGHALNLCPHPFP